MAELALGLVAVYLVLTAGRIGLAVSHLRRTSTGARERRDRSGESGQRPPESAEQVTVLQAIRSGDPLMPGVLAANRVNLAGAHLVWLVDEDDPAGVTAAQAAAHGAGARVEVLLVPPLVHGRNPKVAKLVVGLERAGPLVAVLDDDTVLPAGALERAVDALADGDLVTGVPVYREQGSLWSRLVAGFVNGSSLVTYPTLARVGAPVTINGMFSLTRRSVLEELGGFVAIQGRVCDDYELALLYRRAGLRIVQSPVVHALATTVRGPGDYLRIMRRWMVFATQVLRADLTAAMVVLVVLPTALPLAALAAAALSGRPEVVGAVVAGLLAKAVAMALLRRAHPPAPCGPLGVLLEVVADLATPLHAVAATVGPRTVMWRDRQVEVPRAAGQPQSTR